MNMQATKAKKQHPTSLTQAQFSKSAIGRVKHFYWRYFRNARRTWLAWRNREQVGAQAALINARLQTKGLLIADSATILSAGGQAALAEASKRIRDDTKADWVQTILNEEGDSGLNKNYLIHMVPVDMVHGEDSPYLKVALDPDLLNIVSSYLGVWPELFHIGAWLNFPVVEEAKMSQLWHRDPEDDKFLKVFIYLEDVGEKNGPFSFIPETHPFGALSDIVPRHEHKRRITDEEMAAGIPEERWVKCTGPANTMVIADTVGFHRGGKVEEGRRLLMTFTYTSGAPRKKRLLRASGIPSWASLPIQKSALEHAVGR